MTEEFNLLYDKLYKENAIELEKYRVYIKKKVLEMIIPIIIFMILIFIQPLLSLLILPFIFILIIVTFTRGNSKKTPDKYNSEDYKMIFKNNIITPLVESIQENTVYQPKKGISENIFRESRFDNQFDEYSSEDQINVLLADGGNGEPNYLTLSEVKIKKEHIDSEGHKSMTIVFNGVVGYIDINKKSNSYIKIKIKNLSNKLNKNNIKMDMTEFEKYFDVEADNKIEAMQILTADIMIELIDFLITSKIKFEINIIKSRLYIRFKTGPIFEPRIFSNTMEKKLIWNYYYMIQFCIKLSIKMCKNVNESHI